MLHRLFVSKYSFSNPFVQAVTRSLVKKPPVAQKCPILFANKVLQKIDRKHYSQPNIVKLRAKVDLEQKIEDLENELKREISRSLRNTEQKLLTLLVAANAAHKHLQDKRKMLGEDFETKEKAFIMQYNQLVKHCQEARWNFIVQRHCVGFTIKNHQLVCSMYPIPEAYRFTNDVSA